MVAGQYVPDAGDLIWLDFSPQTGREQAGRRPAVVLSPIAYNEKTGLAIVCPITSRAKGYAFEVAVPPASRGAGGIAGVILADHLRNLDWRQRKAEKAGKLPATALDLVRSRVATLLQIV